MKGDTSEPVYPALFNGQSLGLTKREWFAGMALQGMLASDFGRASKDGEKFPDWQDSIGDYFAKLAFKIADAMLAAQ